MMALAVPSALADYGDMMGDGMMGGVGMGLYGILWLTLAAFLFSVIFWYTYKLIIKNKMRGKK